MASWRTDRTLQFLRTAAFGVTFAVAGGITFGQIGGLQYLSVFPLLPGDVLSPQYLLSIGDLHYFIWGLTGRLTGLGGGFALSVTAGMAAGAAFGVTFGIAGGRHRAWTAYLVASYRLAWAGLLPRNLMPFMEDAHRLGLLRAVGPVYQLRHAELHDYLAKDYEHFLESGRHRLNRGQVRGSELQAVLE